MQEQMPCRRARRGEKRKRQGLRPTATHTERHAREHCSHRTALCMPSRREPESDRAGLSPGRAARHQSALIRRKTFSRQACPDLLTFRIVSAREDSPQGQLPSPAPLLARERVRVRAVRWGKQAKGGSLTPPLPRHLGERRLTIFSEMAFSVRSSSRRKPGSRAGTSAFWLPTGTRPRLSPG